ncbi:glycosyltransferase [Actinokineospora auranticolor]|uniref:MGT family glycosyltransferase n=1 Tax=Actinokineospora auranticolor TaxID=155976 RepID=A0A2S6H1L3_9PSEU|nr:macrolide family glycosyltransferase [Actinokineospora auranticolor]PPK71306.1 MGT family glycosyltransferase [Actinokineospora auranticolor]
MSPGHVLFLPLPAYGHVMPTLAVVAELVARGHRVTFATTAEFAPAVVAAGAEPLLYESELAGKAQPERFTTDYVSREPLRCITENIVTTRLFDKSLPEPPDVYVYDVSTFPAGRALAQKHGARAIQLFPVFASNERFVFGHLQAAELDEPISAEHPAIVDFLAKVAEFIDEHGLGVSVERFLTPCDATNLVFMPREFQINAADFDARHTFVGPCLNPSSDVSWEPPADGRPVVLISLGTTFNRNPEFFRRCAEAFADLPWHVVLTLGSRVAVAELGELPSNVEAHRWLPHAAVLPHASVFVCHAGMGTMMEALAFGVPLVLVPPDVTEHRINARRAAELGLGRSVDASAPGVRDAVLAVAADSAIREHVNRMRDVLSALDGPAVAADVVAGVLQP